MGRRPATSSIEGCEGGKGRKGYVIQQAGFRRYSRILDCTGDGFIGMVAQIQGGLHGDEAFFSLDSVRVGTQSLASHSPDL